VGFNWTAYFRAIGRTRPIAVVTIAAATIFVLAGIPLLVAFGLPGFAAGVAAQALGSLILRAYYLQQLFPGFDFLRHAARAFLPTVPAVALVALVRLLGSGDAHTFAAALGQFAGYVAVTLAATWYFERRLLREALQQVLGRPVAAVAT
jgi:O-antigen/teichoic acid export membrane protein